MTRLLHALLLLLLFFGNAVGENHPSSPLRPRPEWNVDFGFIFDNREGDHAVTPAKTITFTRLSPEIGLSLDSGRHLLSGGVVWIQPVGNGWHDYHLDPTLYYRYRGQSWSGALGMLPRSLLLGRLPAVMWGDSAEYFQRNIRGGLLQYHNGRGYAQAYLDWRQLQSETRREAFNIVISTEWTPLKNGILLAGGHAMMNHYALTSRSLPDEHIVDNFVVHPYIGVSLGSRSRLDSLTVKAGPLLTLERNRENGGWKSPVGLYAEIYASKGRWYARNALYAGGVQMPSFSSFGSALYQGQPFFSRRFYDRLDAGFRIISTRAVAVDASLDFNFYSGGFIFYQKITAEVNLPSGRF